MDFLAIDSCFLMGLLIIDYQAQFELPQLVAVANVVISSVAMMGCNYVTYVRIKTHNPCCRFIPQSGCAQTARFDGRRCHYKTEENGFKNLVHR